MAVQAGVERFTRVCSYDRAGYGRSDAGPQPRSTRQIAGELHTLLSKAQERGPYVLVGHSFGRYNVRVYAGLYRDEVSGAVLVDSSHEDQQRFQPASVRQEAQNLRQFAPFPMLRFFGLLRLRDKLRPAAVRGSKLPLGFGHFPRVTAVQVLQATFSVYGEGLKQSRRKSPLLGFRKSSWRSTWQAGSPPYWIGDCRS